MSEIEYLEQNLANAEDEIRALKVTNKALTYSLKMAHSSAGTLSGGATAGGTQRGVAGGITDD